MVVAEPGSHHAARHAPRVAGAALAASAIATLALMLVAPPAPAATTTVRYRDLTLHVPAAWPVYRLARQPLRCVRFDRHALYLGRPSAEQRCPNRAIGRAAAALVEPIRAAGARRRPLAAKAPSGATIARLAASRVQIVAGGPRAARTTRRLLGRSAPPLKASPERARGPSAQARGLAAVAPTSVSSFKGLGFDTCSAPSTTAMSAWRASPYRAIGIYLGGINSACVQPNLTANWVGAETAAGWHLVPIYVGRQAPSTSCGCATITAGKASTQGAAAAADAVKRAESLGIGTGSPIYFDMEAYSRGSSSAVVLAFLAGWTNGLHAGGYLSGAYSSGASGITDLVGAADSTYKEPDDIWVADWNGKATTTDPYLPGSLWASHRRIHQYRGGHTERYGGVSISIDNDALDADTAGVGTGDGVGGGGGGSGGGAPSFANQLSFIKTRHTGGAVEVHLDALDDGAFERSLDATSDFPTAAGRNGSWQLFGRANGAPELGFVKERRADGTVEVQWDTLQGDTYRRAGSAASDFRPADGRNGRWQLFGGAHGVPKLGFIKLRHSGKHVGVRWDVLRGRSYHRAGVFTSDFRTAERKGGRWQLLGGARGAPELGFIKLRHARRRVTVHWDALRRGSYRRAGDYRTEFGTHAARNGVWQLIDAGGRAPELGFVKLRSTQGSIEGHWELLQGASFKQAGDAASDFSPTQAKRGIWQLSPF